MRTVNVLGRPMVASPTVDDVCSELLRRVAARERGYVCLVNVHVLEYGRRDTALAGALGAADMLLPDGSPVAWLTRWFGRDAAARVAGADVFEGLCSKADDRFSHFFYGSTQDTLAALTAKISEHYPRLKIAGTYSPPFRPLTPVETVSITNRINNSGADIVWVGLGAPKQEVWMHQMRDALEAPLLVGVGAVFDFASGRKKRAPWWLQAVGLEWFHRLVSEPRRLASRYFRTNATFVFRVAMEMTWRRLRS